MNFEPQLTYAQDPTTITVAGTVLAGLAAFAGAAILVPVVARNILPKPKETHLSDFLPFEALDRDGKTVLMKDGSFTRYYVISGIDQTFMDATHGRMAARSRMEFLEALADINVVARIFTQRVKIKIEASDQYPNEVAREVATKWNSQFQKSYRTVNVIALSSKTLAKLEEAEQALNASLSAFGVFPLTQVGENPERMTLGEFLGAMVSPASKPAPKSTGTNLSEVLAGDVVWFRPDGIIEFTGGARKKYAMAIGVKTIGDEIGATLSTELASLPIEMNISRYVEPMSKTEAILKLEQHSRLAAASSFNSAQVMQSFHEAQAMVEGGDEHKASLCAYCQTIFIYGESIQEILEHEKTIHTVLKTNGATAVRECGASQASWFLQFPTLDLLPRPYRLFTFNIAYEFMLDRPPVGLPRSGWGDGAIANFRTASNTVYQHQFHVSEAKDANAHGVVIAPTSSGKTVLMEFLSLMTSRHRNVRHFFFDRYQGTAIYNLAMGGKYISMNAAPLPWSETGGMNPFDCDDTDENRSFLKLWISSITGCSESQDITEISDAVDMAFDELAREERALSTIHEAFLSPGSRIRNEMSKWVSPTGYGPLFNAERDTIDIEDSWLTTFDMTKLLEDSKLGAATVHYLMHKIRGTMARNKAPGFIFIDETAPLLEDENFRKLFKIALQEFRKIHGSVISVFQRPSAMKDAGVSDLVRTQSGTYYLFQNPGARASDYGEFQLSERELAFVLGQSGIARQAKRSILIKRPSTHESVIVDVDLSSLGPHLKIFSSDTSDVNLVSELYHKMEGKWIERYLRHDAP